MVAAWAGFSGMAADTTVGGSLFATLGLTTALVPRIIGVISEAGYTAAIQTWRVPRRNLGILTGHQWLHQIVHLLWLNLVRQLFGRACRIAAGNGETLEDLRAKAKAAGTASAAPAPASNLDIQEAEDECNSFALHATTTTTTTATTATTATTILQLRQLQQHQHHYNYNYNCNYNYNYNYSYNYSYNYNYNSTTALHHTTSRSCE